MKYVFKKIIDTQQKLSVRNLKRGFTLIELLVVVAIIGLLGSIVSSSLQDARSTARDVKRVQEVRSIENALYLYSLDNGGYIPKSNYSGLSGAGSNIVPKKSDGTIDCELNKENTDTLFDILVPEYLASKPSDDPMEDLGYCYVYVSSGDITYTAGAEYDANGNLVSPPVLLATVDSSTKNRHAVFFSSSENTRTNSGNSAIIGISFGSLPPVILNIDLTTGIRSNTSYDQPVVEPLVCGANKHESSGECVCNSGYLASGDSCILDTNCEAGYVWNTNSSSCTLDTSCEAGYVWNTNSSSCVVDTTCQSGYQWDGTACILDTSCPNGQIWSTVSSSCVQDTSCQPGYVWNAFSSSCVQDTSCQSGYTWDSSTSMCIFTQSCQNGYVWSNASGSCVLDTTCPAGQEWDQATLTCVIDTDCNVGYTWDSSTLACVQDTSCSAGYFWNPSTQACVQDTSCPADYVWNGYECTVDTTCPSGGTWNGTECAVLEPCADGQTRNAEDQCVSVCSDGTSWNGSECVSICSDGTAWNGYECASVCDGSSTWNGTECVPNDPCPGGGSWNGSYCEF